MKINQYFKFLLGLVLITSFNSTFAGTLNCLSSAGGYCNYSGKISRVYVNRGNILLIYTDAAMDLSQLTNAGDKFAAVTQASAIAVDMNEYPEFGKHVLSLALTAGMADKSISLQVRDRYGSYLQMDRIWLYK